MCKIYRFETKNILMGKARTRCTFTSHKCTATDRPTETDRTAQHLLKTFPCQNETTNETKKADTVGVGNDAKVLAGSGVRRWRSGSQTQNGRRALISSTPNTNPKLSKIQIAT